MGPGYFVIAILGCADGGASCTPIATLSQRYETTQQCEASLPDALSANNDFDFPTILATCNAGTPRTSERSTDRPIPAGAMRG